MSRVAVSVRAQVIAIALPRDLLVANPAFRIRLIGEKTQTRRVVLAKIWGIIDDSGHDMDDRVAGLLLQLPLSTRILFACFKLVYYFVVFYGELPKPLKHGYLFFAKFKTFLLKR